MHIYRADLVYSESRDKLAVRKGSCIAVENGTFHACVFGTIHREATSHLLERMEERKLSALVIRNFSDPFRGIEPQETVERFCYTGSPADILARFIGGEAVRPSASSPRDAVFS